MGERSRLSASIRELARLRVDSVAALRRAEDLIETVGASRSLDAIPVLLPMLVARAWPDPTPPRAGAHRLALAASAARAIESIIASHGVRAAPSIDQRARGR